MNNLFILFFRFAVILTFALINFQLAYYYYNTRIREFLLLFLRFAFGMIVLFQVNFVNSIFSLKVFFVLFITPYLFLLLFIRKVVQDPLSFFLVICYCILALSVFLLEPLPSGSSPILLPIPGIKFISFPDVVGVSVGGFVVFTNEHPWPFVFFRILVSFYLFIRILGLETLDYKSRNNWLLYLGFHVAFDILFLFSLDVIRLAILWIANGFFFWVVWKKPHFLVLTNPQLISLHDQVLRIEKAIRNHHPVPFTNSEEIIDYISHVGKLLDEEN